ncbi:MAG: hypothetical protein M1308_06415 [Actinobacteria bacterium]|nr:hypothetical protein [Actinomycetota bacterium]
MEKAEITKPEIKKLVLQALILWGIFIVVNIINNNTIPFILGKDVHNWTYSNIKALLYGFFLYSIIFLTIPLIIVKGWKTVRKIDFMLPLIAAIVAITLRYYLTYIPAVAILILGYLHWRFNLSELGIRSKGWKIDIIYIVIVGLLTFLPKLIPLILNKTPFYLSPLSAFISGMDRIFANPGSSVENLFYFGFLAERLSYKTGRWLTPLIIAAMYTIHEMSNPEYWYEGVQFYYIFIGVFILTIIYLNRRNVLILWLGSGLGIFLSQLFVKS